jgi:hypothetical protein
MDTTEPVIDSFAETSRFLQLVREESRNWEAQNKTVWSALVKLQGNPLPKGDEVLLGRRIYGEFPRLKSELKRQKLTLGEFCARAGLGARGEYSKELHRLMLAPAADPAKARLRRSASKYKDLIAAMAKVLGVNRLALAEQLLRETSLHHGNNADRSEVEWVEANLQLLVDTVNAEFQLLDSFRETAELKAAHAAQGGECRWPQYESHWASALYSPELMQVSACRLLDTLRGGNGAKSDEETALEQQAAIVERNVAMNVDRAYWKKPVTKSYNTFNCWTYGPTPSGCLQDDTFFYVPHAYLGHGWGICNLVDPDLDPIDRERELELLRTNMLDNMQQFGAVPLDDWDEVQQCPKGQTSSLAHKAAHDHAWLVAYPSPDNQCVMPMLYLAVEECGPILVPLDCVALTALKKLYWVGPDGSISTYLDRIKALLLAQPEGGGPLMAGLRRTAPWLRSNPFFKTRQQELEEIERLKSLHKSLSEKLARHHASAR